MTDIWVPLVLTVLAGLATSIGGMIGVAGRGDSRWLMSMGLGFSAGVMIYVSLVEILPKGREALISEFGDAAGEWLVLLAFFGGIAVIALIDRLVPEEINPHEPGTVDDRARQRALMRTGILTAIALGVHNFPEGFATFIAAIQNPEIGVAVAVAIAIHNIPEGLAVAVPVYQATGSRRKALRWATVSGLAEPAGAIVGYLLLMPFISDGLFGVVFAAIAGVMVFISLDELLPTAEEYGEHHWAIYGLVAGMAVMGISLVLL